MRGRMAMAVPAVLAVVVVGGACGGAPSVAGTAVVADEAGPLTDVPTYPGSQPVGEGQKGDDGSISRGFRAAGATPTQVMAFYAKELRGSWEVGSTVAPIGPATFRASWSRRGTSLSVVAQPAPAIVPGTTDYRLTVSAVPSA